MPDYLLTEEAVQDLQEVAQYTLKHWGKAQLEQYRQGLKVCFERIATGDVRARSFSMRFPNLLVTKYRQHFIFFLFSSGKPPVILGVIHEKRDIVKHLKARLS